MVWSSFWGVGVLSSAHCTSHLLSPAFPLASVKIIKCSNTHRRVLTIERRSHSDGPILVRLKAELKKIRMASYQRFERSRLSLRRGSCVSHCRPPPPHNPQSRPTRAHTSSGVIEHPPVQPPHPGLPSARPGHRYTSVRPFAF